MAKIRPSDISEGAIICAPARMNQVKDEPNNSTFSNAHKGNSCKM